MNALFSAIAIEAVFAEIDSGSQPVPRTKLLYLGLRCLIAKMATIASNAYWRGWDDGRVGVLVAGFKDIEVGDLR